MEEHITTAPSTYSRVAVIDEACSRVRDATPESRHWVQQVEENTPYFFRKEVEPLCLSPKLMRGIENIYLL